MQSPTLQLLYPREIEQAGPTNHRKAMAKKSRKPDNPPDYYPLPPRDQQQEQHPQYRNYIVIPLHVPAFLRRGWRCRLSCAGLILLLAFAVYFLWPSDPELKVARFHLENLHLHTTPSISVDIKLDLTVNVRNPDLYSMDYSSINVSIGYRGKKLGFVIFDGGHIKARGSSYVNATLELDGVEILSDVLLLIEDVARGSIPFDTVTEVRGQLGFLFFEIPIKAKISCELDVNTRNKRIARQNCFPE